METKLANLQRQVAELEAALAIVSKRTDRPELRRWVALAPLMCAGVLILCVGILLGGSARSLAAAQSGPTKVVAPFSVVDSDGRELFRVASASGAGVAIVYDNGVVQLTLGSPRGQGKPSIQVLSPSGDVKAGIGITTEGDGQIVLSGKGKTRLSLSGAGGLSVSNKDDKRVVSLGGGDAEGGAGNLHLYDSNGTERVTVRSPLPGSGKPNIEVLGSDGSSKAGIGVSEKGSGLIALKGGQAQTSLWLHGTGLLEALNAQDKRVVSLGVSGFGGGDLHLYNSSATAVVGIFSEQGQTGIAQFFNAAGQERVSLGTKFPSGKGDVCASGNQAANCLSHMLNPKY